MRMTIALVLILGACAGDEVDEGTGPVCTKALEAWLPLQLLLLF